MTQVTVTIAGRVYRMACDEGQEAHLEALAVSLDRKIAEMRAAFGEIGDHRLTVMAAIAFADGESEGERRVAALEAELENARNELAHERERRFAWAETLAEELDRASDRIEKMARELINTRE